MINKIDYIAIAGDSGGHIFPAIKYINELSKIKNPENILFITNERGTNFCDQIKNKNVNIYKINSKNKILFIFNVIRYLTLILFKNKKIILIGFGGFITSPVLFLAKFFNILFFSNNKIFIHEQNYILGLANKINCKIVDRIFTSFPTDNFNKKEIFVGNFFNESIVDKEKLDDNFINILLLGGSGGSLEINNILLNKLKKLDVEILKNIHLSIQIPTIYLNSYKEKYLDISKNINFFSFNPNLDYKNYDLIISRSGSGSLNDILYLTNSVHFIPHLHSRDNHQSLNLNFYKKYCHIHDILEIPVLKKDKNPFYISSIINPFSIQKIICYTTR